MYLLFYINKHEQVIYVYWYSTVIDYVWSDREELLH